MIEQGAIRNLKDILYQFQSSLDEAKSEFAEPWQRESLDDNKESVESLEIAIKALEKQIPHKPSIPWCKSMKSFHCVNCSFQFVAEIDGELVGGRKYNYCPECGWKVDWSDSSGEVQS